ncbi:MAG: anti-sigma factor [Gemmatimonadota bacterium]|jgi:anti-sigma factor RsiW
MNGPDCEHIVNLLPEWARGVAPPEEAHLVEAHLEFCPECAKALEVIRALQDTRPTVPEGLEARVQARLREELQAVPHIGSIAERRTRKGRAGHLGVRRFMPTWAMSAAAILVLALGTKVVMDRTGTDLVLDPIAVAAQEPLPESWLWDDGMVAGALVFDGLSDEDLEALLEELEG